MGWLGELSDCFFPESWVPVIGSGLMVLEILMDIYWWGYHDEFADLWLFWLLLGFFFLYSALVVL